MQNNQQFITRIKRFVSKNNSGKTKVTAAKIIENCSVPLKRRAMNYCLEIKTKISGLKEFVNGSRIILNGKTLYFRTRNDLL